ncbi:SET domain-containing protein [Candidatus Micrarchaeota archaeon]|nr:SET domain-containing protein [Candidatus Micrarchaeota archaeon]
MIYTWPDFVGDKVHIAQSNNPYFTEDPWGKGLGVFALEKIKKGDDILLFTGPDIDFFHAVGKGLREGDPVQIKHDRYLDLFAPGVFVNHSCTPNAGIKDDFQLVALRDIPAGKEIFYDYSTTLDEQLWTMRCRCGEPSCRNRVEDFHLLPDEIRNRYLDLGIVQRFIAEQY